MSQPARIILVDTMAPRSRIGVNADEKALHSSLEVKVELGSLSRDVSGRNVASGQADEPLVRFSWRARTSLTRLNAARWSARPRVSESRSRGRSLCVVMALRSYGVQVVRILPFMGALQNNPGFEGSYEQQRQTSIIPNSQQILN